MGILIIAIFTAVFVLIINWVFTTTGECEAHDLPHVEVIEFEGEIPGHRLQQEFVLRIAVCRKCGHTVFQCKTRPPYTKFFVQCDEKIALNAASPTTKERIELVIERLSTS